MAQKLGYQTTTATTAVDALHVLGKTVHDVVMVEYDLPQILGFHLAAQIRSKHPGTRVIIMTSRCEAEITNQIGCLEIADGLLLKPFKLESMGNKIENILNFDLRKDHGQEFSRPYEKKLQPIHGTAFIR